MSSRTRTPSLRDPTVLEVLQRLNPELSERDLYTWAEQTSGDADCGASRTPDVVVFNDNHPAVKPWTDFTFEAISLAYGDILDMGMSTLRPKFRPVLSQYVTPTNIFNVDRISILCLVWSTNIIRDPLKGAASILRPRFCASTDTDPTFYTQWIQWKDPSDPSIEIKPLWTVLENNLPILANYREDHDPYEKPLVYLVGETSLTQTWKSEWLSRSDDNLTVELDLPFRTATTVKTDRLAPLIQLATTSRFAQTRYAYILTQTELVALRIRRLPKPTNPSSPEDKVPHHAGIEYASVPWSASSGLTVNLAIWALACMGINDAHREMEAAEPRNSPLEGMARLTWWRYDEENEVYENVISKRQIKVGDWDGGLVDRGVVQLTEEGGVSWTRDFLPGGGGEL